MPALKPLKPLRHAPPVGIERDYAVKIRKTIKKTGKLVRDEVVTALPEILTSYNLEIKQDDAGDELLQIFSSVRQRVTSSLELDTGEFVKKTGTQTSWWNKKENSTMLKNKYGVDFYENDSFLGEFLKVFVINNVNLIKSANIEFLDKTEQVVYSGMRSGLRHESIAQKIFSQSKDKLGRNSPYSNALTRASIIARDQVNKANGDLTMVRQARAGVKKYVWRTAGDVRVRPLHQSYSGKKYSWTKGTPEGLHPGMDIMCRCYAEPVFD